MKRTRMNSESTIKSKIIAYLDGDIDSKDLEELSDWISKSKENARYFSRVKDFWESSLTNVSQIADTENEWKKFQIKVLSEKKSISPSIKIWKTIFRVAAVLLLGVFIGKFTDYLSEKPQPIYCTAIAPEGSISNVILPDSTIIYLNAGSEIKYSVNPNIKEREVFLSGEAWFDVSKDSKRPFTVHTDYFNVNVLGTEFNVKAYAQDLHAAATLEEGSILVTSSSKVKLAENIKLRPGEQFVFNKDEKSVQIKEVDTQIYSSWKDNKLIFLKMSLRELIILLERKYGVDIEVLNPEILEYHYSGTIKNESIIEILNIIEHTIPIDYEILDQEIIIKKK